MIFNPFNEVFRTHYSPFSEILRHGLSNKIIDTFQVLFGIFNDNVPYPPISQLGVIDYLSLGALTLPFLFLDWADKNKSKELLAKALFPLAWVLFVPTMLTRAIISGACLLASLPIILLVHGISSFFSKNLIQEALSLEVKKGETDESITIGQAIEIARGNLWTPEEAVSIDFAGVHAGIAHKHNRYVVMDERDEPFFTLPQSFSYEKEKPSQQKAFRALLKLNLFGYTEQLEQNTQHTAGPLNSR